jgi:hypothetical protein
MAVGEGDEVVGEEIVEDRGRQTSSSAVVQVTRVEMMKEVEEW